ncbi:echinoderm microtubule-associated protein-like 2 isoform X3 [Rhopilema esculentum]|uniref:echinoderm microtubule-associated protein-like 2 isoform X3 n=1 Tax=Rhopilema esculentum TaxID=499914 RepID=UPI0031CED9F5
MTEPPKEDACEQEGVKEPEAETSMTSPRPRLSQHSLSLSGASELADLIAKARSDFSQSLREDMKRFDSPRSSSEKSRRLVDLNENSIYIDKMEGEGSPRLSRANMRLSLSRTSSSGLDSPNIPQRLSPDELKIDIGGLSPRPADSPPIRPTSPRLSEINAIINGSHVSSRIEDASKAAEKEEDAALVVKSSLDEATINAILQQRLKGQDNEILVLKTALSNVVRRLESLETERKQRSASFPNGAKPTPHSPLPAAAILPSQPKNPMKGRKNSFDEEKEAYQQEKPVHVKKPLVRRATDSPRRSTPTPAHSSQGPAISGLNERRRSISKKHESLRRTGSLSALSNGGDSSPKDEIVKFYIRGRAVSTYPPSNFVETKRNGQAPTAEMKLEWVYGYRGRDCRNNLFVLPSGEIVYHIAAVIILLDRSTGEQRHYLGHTDDVKCIALHPDKVIIASGQVAGHSKEDGKPHVRIWDSNTLETLQVIGMGYFERALSCLTFSIKDGGKLLAAVDEANEHIMSLWDWAKNSRFSDNKGSNEAVLGVVFHPSNNSTIVSYGRSHIAFWTVTDDMKLTKKMGIFEKYGKPKFVLCAAFTESGDLLSGDSNGNVFVWGQGSNRISKAVKEAHSGGIFSICCMSDGKILTGGGKDKRILEWDQCYKKTGREIDIPENAGQVRAITEGPMSDDDALEIIVGTTKNCILDGTISSGLGFVIQGHVDELWGLATHPTKEMFVTCGTDELVFLWDADGHDVIWSKQLKEPAQSAAFHPFAPVLAVGMKSGRWLFIDSDTSEDKTSFQHGPEQHDAIKYSPDGKYLAVGSHDNFIYLYNVSDDGRTYKKCGKLSGPSSFVTHLDWSKDSQHIQSNSGDYEILYWHAPTCRQIVAAASMKDEEWETWTCVLGFPVIGIWPEGADGTDINACCRSNNQEYVVTGDDFGQVNFFNFPSTKPKADSQRCVGHSSHVTCVRFMYDDNRMISVGGKDSAVMQWRIS